MRFFPRLSVAAVLLLSVAFAAQAQRGRAPGAVALSPDGSTIAWTLRGAEGATLHLTDVANPDPAKEKLISVSGATACSYGSPIWSPDSQTLAFISTCTGKEEKPGQEEIFLWSRATGAVKQLTHVVGNIEQPAWSPDGKSIAFLFVENATRSAGALDAMPPWDGVIGEDHVEIQGVYGVEVGSGKGDWVVRPKTVIHVYEFAWAPNSSSVAYIAASAPGENNWWNAILYVAYDLRSRPLDKALLQSEDGKQALPESYCLTSDAEEHCVRVGIPVLDPQKITGPLHGLQIAVPRWSPDGKRIALIGGLMSDQGSTGGDVWVVPVKFEATPTDITPGIDGTPCYEAWLDNDTIGFVEDRKGHTVLPDYKVSTHTLVPGSAIDLGEVSLSGGPIKDAITLSMTAKTLAFVKSSYNLPPEIYLMQGGTGKLQQITHLNDGAVYKGPKVESVEWKNEGFDVQGWLTYPANYDPAKKYPMIVEVHGGPSASAGPRGGAAWANLGYFELQPNPRGSFGQGEKFVQANVKDFGYGDLRDILAGVDAVEKKVSIDDHRLGLTGWSYGGFMSMFAETQTNRFRAIVAGAGISDWKSYYGENSIDQWMVPFFGATVYDDPAVYAKSSAIEFIKNAKTPMLIIVGDRDGECPAPQSFEMWHALKAEGVKTQLVIYPNEGHGFRNPEHIADRTKRTQQWFADNMPEGRE